MTSSLIYTYAVNYSLNSDELEVFVLNFADTYSEVAMYSLDGSSDGTEFAHDVDEYVEWTRPSTGGVWVSTAELVMDLCYHNHGLVERCAQFLAENKEDIEEYELITGYSAGSDFALELLGTGVGFRDRGREELFDRLGQAAHRMRSDMGYLSSIKEGVCVYLGDDGTYEIMLGQGERQEPIEYASRAL